MTMEKYSFSYDNLITFFIFAKLIGKFGCYEYIIEMPEFHTSTRK